MKPALRRLADFEWAYVAQYMVYLSAAANLAEIDTNKVLSFPLARLGPVNVIARKKLVLAALEGNMARLERFAGKHKGDLEESEVVVLRSMYATHKRYVEVVKEHIKTARLYSIACRIGLFEGEEDLEDELPF